jgi:hypothetical protein
LKNMDLPQRHRAHRESRWELWVLSEILRLSPVVLAVLQKFSVVVILSAIPETQEWHQLHFTALNRGLDGKTFDANRGWRCV